MTKDSLPEPGAKQTQKSKTMSPITVQELGGLYVVQEVVRHNPLQFIVVAARVVPDWDEKAPPLDVLIARSSGSTLVDLSREKLIGKRVWLTKVTFDGNCLYLARE